MFCKKGVPSIVVEDAIKNTHAVPEQVVGTFVHKTSDITVVVN
mgnify:CR=1 FL=1